MLKFSKTSAILHTTPFTILKSLNPTGQLACLEKMTLIREKLVIYLKTTKYFGIIKHFKMNLLSTSKCHAYQAR